MQFVDNREITDPSTNIALETCLVENRLSDEPLLLFYINEPSIIIGRNQNTVEEVKMSRYCCFTSTSRQLLLAAIKIPWKK